MTFSKSSTVYPFYRATFLSLLLCISAYGASKFNPRLTSEKPQKSVSDFNVFGVRRTMCSTISMTPAVLRQVRLELAQAA